MAAGSIVRLKLQNFMTYDSLEITPCPGLNLITGPNGTGKSSLLCALNLGLGGKPSSIGRANQTAAYVKMGCDKAYIEIELLNPDGENVVIGRVITASNNCSSWSLCGRATAHKMVEQEVAKFNIQTDNLCQFLPQEKVAHFAKMNPVELLESTEQAVGDENLYNDHVKLKELQTKYCALASALNGTRKTLEEETDRNKRLEGEVKQHRERQKHLKKIQTIEKKIVWMKYEKVRDELFKKEKDRKELTAHRKECQAKMEPMKKEKNLLGQQLLKVEKNTEALDKEIRQKKMEAVAAQQNFEEVDSKVADLKSEISAKIKEERARFEKIENKKTVLRNFEAEWREACFEDSITEQRLAAIAMEVKDLNVQLLEADREKQNCTMRHAAISQNINEIDNGLAKLQQDQYHRINILKFKEQDTFKAVMWLRENQKLFKKMIYEPILTLINVLDAQAVKYIENHIAYRDLIAFLAEDKEDMDKFLHHVCDKFGLAVNGICAVAEPEEMFRPKKHKNFLAKLGLTHYLRELFTAPAPVMNYLCKNYRIHNLPVGFNYSSDLIRRIEADREFDFHKFYLGDFVYKVKWSKYGDHTRSSASQKIVDSGLLKGFVDPSKIKEQEEKRREFERNAREELEKHSSYSDNERNLNAHLEKLKVEKKELQGKRDFLKNLSGKIHAMQQHLKILEIPVCNIEEEESRLCNFITNSVQEKIRLTYCLNELHKQIFSFEKDKVEKSFTHYFLTKKKSDVENLLQTGQAEIDTINQSLDELKTVCSNLKAATHAALCEAKKTLNLKPSEDVPASLKSKVYKEFESLPGGITDLENEVSREQAKLNCIYRTNPAIIDEYVNREKSINELKETINTKETELEAVSVNTRNVRDQWLPAVEGLIQKINVNFGRYFCSLGCAGEVSLDKTENPDDYQKYGISIKVKFRNEEPLSQLSHAHHSGGECSVSTILYILSLQELTEVPFRCVDEINQGMDSSNERNVFDLIVKSSCSKKKSQYFLITPKLLHGLEYPPEMEIAIIHNGSAKKFHWDIENFFKIKSALSS